MLIQLMLIQVMCPHSSYNEAVTTSLRIDLRTSLYVQIRSANQMVFKQAIINSSAAKKFPRFRHSC
ncbi:hypothetical protein [Candidatus Enterovibrio escicola]|uniref:hypothetical protein n=1 Tax=Candidatus Enterovibrio escicola TaxID=1927127 RepID=UPI0030D8E3C7